jgi:hypothetical protein
MIQGIPVLSVGLSRGSNDTANADHYGPSGDDSPPLPGDFAHSVEGVGNGEEQITGYHDPQNEGQALPGEKRLYARDEDGAIVGTIWLKRDGTIRIETDAPVVIDSPDVRLGDGSAPVATAGDLVAVVVPTLVCAAPGSPAVPLNPTQVAPGGYTAIGQILRRQSKVSA